MANPFEELNEMYEEQLKEADKAGNAELFEYATEKVVDWMNEAGFTVENIEYLNGYFIFASGTNSTIHYNIKECPSWNFGIWWGKNEKTNNITGEFFCEHKQNMDKFKPSRCEYCSTCTFTEDELNNNDPHYDFKYEWLDTLRFISKHPIRAFYRTYCGTDFNRKYVSGIKCLMKYIKFKCYRFNETAWNKHFEKSELIFIRKHVLPFCNYDSEHKAELVYMGDNCSPMYDIQCKIPDTANADETGCFGIFDSDAILDEYKSKAEKVKARWDRLVKRHEKISDVFHFFADRICDDCVTFWRGCDFKDD